MSDPVQYKFKYSFDHVLKNGKTFHRSGIIKGIHQRHAIDKIKRAYPKSKPVVKPYFTGKKGGSELAFHYS